MNHGCPIFYLDYGMAVGDKRKQYPTKRLDEYKYTDFRRHDLRHTWASWHVHAGTPLHALQELGGWAGPEMVQRYAHLSAEHLAGYAENVGRPEEGGANVVSLFADTKKAAIS